MHRLLGGLSILTGIVLFAYVWRRIRAEMARLPSGLNVVITGASSGIGAELALQYARHGANLVLAARRRDQLSIIADKCRQAGATVEICPTDVTVDADCKNLATTAAMKFNGKVDILVLNAGIGMRGRVDEITDPSIYRKLMETNYLGSVTVTHYFIKLIQAAKGRIVVVSSASGRLGVPKMAGYSASKHALHGFFDALRCEGTDVTMVCPGFVATDMPQKNMNADGTPVGTSDQVDRGTPMPVSEAAARIVQAAARGENEAVYDALTRIAIMARAFVPSLVDWQLRRRMDRKH